jgi:tRNA U34 5-methylaminomethyl-2-thiouridine-forming methyltransferase MnmC
MAPSNPATAEGKVAHPLDWVDGQPVSLLFGDKFYSATDGQGESTHVFLAGNGLPERWRGAAHFTLAELGFGTGLNFLETWRHWIADRAPGQCLTFVSFERYPLDRDAMATALSKWTGIERLSATLLDRWTPKELGAEWPMDEQTTLQVVPGDALGSVTEWTGRADVWFLDGFAPSKNPDMWSAELMRVVAAHTAPGGTFATYTAAGWVRRNLQAAGFTVEKRSGFASKREMMCGQYQKVAGGS